MKKTVGVGDLDIHQMMFPKYKAQEKYHKKKLWDITRLKYNTSKPETNTFENIFNYRNELGDVLSRTSIDQCIEYSL